VPPLGTPGIILKPHRRTALSCVMGRTIGARSTASEYDLARRKVQLKAGTTILPIGATTSIDGFFW